MGYAIFTLGGIFGISGFIVYWFEYKLCCKVVKAVASDPEGLTHREIWLNTQQFVKLRKLKKYSQTGSPELKKMAKKAIRLEVTSYFLLVTGMIVMVIGSSLY